MSPRAWAAFAGVSILWGIPYLFIKVAVDDGVPPVFLAWVRVTLAAAVLLVLAARAGLLGSVRGRGRVLAIYAIVEIALPFPLIAEGERHVTSSLAAILISAVPMIIAVLALRFDRSERVTGSRLAGLFIGFAGVVLLVGVDVAGRPDELLGAGAILLAAVGYAVGPMLLNRRLVDLDPRATMGVSLAVAAFALAPFAAFSVPDQAPTGDALVALGVLGLLCTAAAFVLFGMLIVEVGPGRASIITYIAPVVAVALGVTVLGESLGAGSIAGLLLILGGSWLSTDGRLPPGVGALVGRLRGRRGTSERPALVDRACAAPASASSR